MSHHNNTVQQQQETILLALPGPRWSLNPKDMQVNNKHIYLKQFSTQDDTSTTLWDASFVLLKYFEKQHLQEWFLRNENTILELGSGTGLLGIGLSLLTPNVKHVIVSDRGECLENLKHNVLENKKLYNDQMATVSVSEVDWFKSDQSIENLEQYVQLKDINMIVLADCVWLFELVNPLVTTIKQIMKKTNAKIFVCNELRSQRVQDAFLNSFSSEEYNTRVLDVSELDPVYHSDKIFVYEISKI
jgi:predicted nicotinamide N-methyase